MNGSTQEQWRKKYTTIIKSERADLIAENYTRNYTGYYTGSYTGYYTGNYTAS